MRPAAEKGPLVVNNSAVHSDHNRGTSHCFEHLFGVGIRPLRRAAELTIHTRRATKSLDLLPHDHLLSASPPFIVPSFRIDTVDSAAVSLKRHVE